MSQRVARGLWAIVMIQAKDDGGFQKNDHNRDGKEYPDLGTL